MLSRALQVIAFSFAATLSAVAGCEPVSEPQGELPLGAMFSPEAGVVADSGSGDATAPAQSRFSTADLQLELLTNSCGPNEVQDFFQVTNKGTTPITLSDITIKFWVDDTSGVSIVPDVRTGDACRARRAARDTWPA